MVGKTDAVRTAYLEGQSLAALARAYDVSRGAIRTAIAEQGVGTGGLTYSSVASSG